MQNGCQQVSLFHFSETDFDSAQEEVRLGPGLWLWLITYFQTLKCT